MHRWHWLPISFVTAGVLSMWGVAIVHVGALGWWQVLIYLGGIVALTAAFWFRRELSATEIELEGLRNDLAAEQARLDKRERALDERFRTYHEWMEFPQPIDLKEPSPAAGQDSPGEMIPRDRDLSDDQLQELAAQDRQLMELLQAQTNALYDNLLTKKYNPDGTFQPTILRDDAYELVRRVARIYQPNAEQPLAETNPALVIRAASRACLQFLVVLDELPLNVKDRSFNALYGYALNAVRAYRAYKSVEPYWPYAQTAYYAGRFAFGATPLTLGAWWFLTALGKPAAQKIVTRLVNHHALKLLSDVVRIIGYEVAGMYAGDFRHRDANWIYAVELTELLHQFSLSRESLSQALKEIGTLQLRSEYDRIFLYRCAAAHASARPQDFRSLAFLTVTERRSIAARLERFLDTFVHGKTAARVQKWKVAAEARLGMKLLVGSHSAARGAQAQLQDAVRSLAGFLIDAKEREPHELAALLASSQMLAQIPESDRAELLTKLAADPPYFFEYADLDPESDLVPQYLEDLASLQARVRPRDAGLEETLLDVAMYLRHDAKKLRALLDKHYAACLSERIAADSPTRNAPTAVARAILDLLETGEQARFIYTDITLEWSAGIAAPEYKKNSLWLLGAGTRAVLFAVEEEPTLLWRGEGDIQLIAEKGLLSSSCKLTGGQWLADDGNPTPTIRIAGARVSSFASYFKPLQVLVETARTNLS